MISGGQEVARSGPGVQDDLLDWKEKREMPLRMEQPSWS